MARRTGETVGTTRDEAASDGFAGEGGVVSDAMDSAKRVASQVVDEVRDQAESRVDQQRQTVASGMQSVADAFHRLGDDLRDKDAGPVAHYAAQVGHAVGGEVERAASYLRGRQLHDLVSDAEEFARRSPGIFLGGAFFLGIAASRFLKSSRPAPQFNANTPDQNRAPGFRDSATGESWDFEQNAWESSPTTTGSPGTYDPAFAGPTVVPGSQWPTQAGTGRARRTRTPGESRPGGSDRTGGL